MSAPDTHAAVARARAFYENLAPADLARLGEVYAPDAHFRDPFNDVRGAAEIERIFAHMFAQLEDCRFEIRDVVVDANGAMMTWDMTFRMRRWRPAVVQRIHGATHFRFDADGRIVYHRDYWDAAEELYEKLPVLGGLMRWLRRRMS